MTSRRLYSRENAGTYVLTRSWASDIDGFMGGFADLDNDGDLDMVFAGDEKVYLNNGAGGFNPVGSQYPSPTSPILARSRSPTSKATAISTSRSRRTARATT